MEEGSKKNEEYLNRDNDSKESKDKNIPY